MGWAVGRDSAETKKTPSAQLYHHLSSTGAQTLQKILNKSDGRQKVGPSKQVSVDALQQAPRGADGVNMKIKQRRYHATTEPPVGMSAIPQLMCEPWSHLVKL